MKLDALLDSLNNANAEHHICVSSGSGDFGDAEFEIVALDDSDDPVVPEGFREFLDVSHARSIILGLKSQGAENLRDRFIAYLSTDA